MGNIYTENGFIDRDEYFDYLAEDYGIDLEIVEQLAEVLGPDEDFDGLPAMLDDRFLI